MVAASAGLLNIPVSYEAIGLSVSADTEGGDESRALRCGVEAEGLAAHVSIETGEKNSADGSDPAVSAEFISERPVGFIKSASGDTYRIVVEHARLEAERARVESIRSPLLKSLGILERDESEMPHSVLYVREALFDAGSPTKWPA